ncbi:MAG: hypothetical protein ACRYG4_25910 [Janthinobacterium lividum]
MARAFVIFLRLTAAVAASGAFVALHAQTAAQGAVHDYATSREEYDAMLKAANGGTKLDPAHLPDWTGIWSRSDKKIFAFDQNSKQRPGDPQHWETTAQLTPPYRQAYEKKFQDIKEGKDWDRLSWCLPAGYPRWLAEPWLRDFVVTPNETWLTHEQINETRRIYTDGRGHVPDKDAIPLWLGDSIGFWDGDTLVIHTNHLKAGQYQRGNPDYSFNTSTVERMRKISPNEIEDRVTIYDPDSLIKPWHAVFHYTKMTQDVRLNYAACEENNNTFRNPDGTSNERLPGEPGYRDGATFGIPEVAYGSIPKQ